MVDLRKKVIIIVDLCLFLIYLDLTKKVFSYDFGRWKRFVVSLEIARKSFKVLNIFEK